MREQDGPAGFFQASAGCGRRSSIILLSGSPKPYRLSEGYCLLFSESTHLNINPISTTTPTEISLLEQSTGCHSPATWQVTWIFRNTGPENILATLIPKQREVGSRAARPRTPAFFSTSPTLRSCAVFLSADWKSAVQMEHSVRGSRKKGLRGLLPTETDAPWKFVVF